jgi:CAP-Gly domain
MAVVKVGDTVMVPGDMHGVVKFVGTVAGKKGTFAGVQLAPEYAPRGKNSGDVDGRHYFNTTIAGAGIFLPIEKAVKRSSAGSTTSTTRSPVRDTATPTRLTSFNQGGRTPAMPKPSFSQSIGPGAMRAGAASPALKPPIRRESLPRPQSPLRKNTPSQKGLATPRTRPSAAGFSKSTMGGPAAYGSARPKPGNAFSQSLRQPSMTPSQRDFSHLGPESSFDEVPEEEAESTPTPTPAVNRQADAEHQEEVRRLKAMLSEKDRELGEQAASIAEMDLSLTELQNMVPGLSDDEHSGRPSRAQDEEDLPRDVVSLRVALRERNEKIKLLTAEFDSNRADFRSTIDALEMASTETERVYEKRVDELLEEVRNLQDRSEDVESVAEQLKQLEELVQELEEGLEDARRGEAEARGEVEFLRGEVERSRSELRRERDRLRTEEQLNGYGSPGGSSDPERYEEMQSQLSSREDEIRGLKAIINSLNSANEGKSKTNGIRGPIARTTSQDGQSSGFEKQIHDLETLLQQKSAREEELESENTRLRSSVQLSKFPMPNSPFGLRSFPQHNASHGRQKSTDNHKRDKHQSSDTVGSQRTVVLSPSDEKREWHDTHDSPSKLARNTAEDPDPDSPTFKHDDSRSEASGSSAALWCEICEESGHDILTCGNMISGNAPAVQTQTLHAGSSHSHQRNDSALPAPLLSRKSNGNFRSSQPGAPPVVAAPPPPLATTQREVFEYEYDAGNSNGNGVGRRSGDGTSEDEERDEGEKRELKAPVEGTGEQAGMWAGKGSGVIDPEKWCALCERDGHESVDCPIEDAF